MITFNFIPQYTLKSYMKTNQIENWRLRDLYIADWMFFYVFISVFHLLLLLVDKYWSETSSCPYLIPSVRLSAAPPILYLCPTSLSSILVISVHSSFREIHFFTTPLGSAPPWGEVSPAVIIFSLLVCRLKTFLFYLRGLKRPKRQSERQGCKSHSSRQTSPTEDYVSLSVFDFIFHFCKTVVETHMLNTISVISLKPFKERKFLFFRFILVTSWLQSSQVDASQVSPVNKKILQ